MKQIIALRQRPRGLLAWLGVMAIVSSALAACTPTVEFTTALPVAPGVTVTLTLASGFRGTAEFRCRGTPRIQVTVIGDETSITLVSGSMSITLEGGPYRYTAPGQTVEFEPGYTEFEWTNASGDRDCRR